MSALATRLLIAATVLVALVAADAERHRILKQIQENPGVADHYVDLGNTLSGEEHVSLLPKTLTRQQAYLLAIQIDPKNAVAFNNLGVTLADIKETVTFGDGTEMNKQELFLKAIESDPKFGHAYNNLAETMQPDQKMNYPDGRQITRRDLFVKSIELDAEYPYAFNNLGVVLAEDEGDNTVKLADGEVLGARRAFLRCIALGEHPALHHCYKNLAQILEEKEIVQLLGANGDRVDKEECLRRAGVARKAAGLADDEDEDM